MRLDKFLKVSRLIKRRTVANEACDAGKIEINDRVAKASSTVKEGDVITLKMGMRTLTVQVNEIKQQVSKDDASSLYEILKQS